MKIKIAALLPLVFAACTPLEPLPLGAENSASAIPTTHLHSAPPVDYRGYKVVDPADWRGVNDSQKEN